MIAVLLGKTKIKTNKLHLATCYLNQSQLQFRFVKCGSGSDLAGAGVAGEGARQRSGKKATPASLV